MNDEVLGYDCDGFSLFEFNIVRAIFYSDIDFEKETDIDPRQYCVVKASDNNAYLVSVYDHWNKKVINRYEGRPIDSDVPIKIKPIDDSVNYERAFDCTGNEFNYSCDRKELVKVLNKKLKCK